MGPHLLNGFIRHFLEGMLTDKFLCHLKFNNHVEKKDPLMSKGKDTRRLESRSSFRALENVCNTAYIISIFQGRGF